MSCLEIWQQLNRKNLGANTKIERLMISNSEISLSERASKAFG